MAVISNKGGLGRMIDHTINPYCSLRPCVNCIYHEINPNNKYSSRCTHPDIDKKGCHGPLGDPRNIGVPICNDFFWNLLEETVSKSWRSQSDI